MSLLFIFADVRGLPVVLFVHGESYSWNSGNVYDGSALAGKAGLIAVTVNYRLGVLGEFFNRVL